jgi:two-component system osmolarity sensor histidine kinase EnvZ
VLKLPGPLTLRLALLLCLLLGFNSFVFRELHIQRLRNTVAPKMAESVAAMVDDIRTALLLIPEADRHLWFERFNSHHIVKLEEIPAGAPSEADGANNPFQTIFLADLRRLEGKEVAIGVHDGPPHRVLVVEFDAQGRRYRLSMPGAAIEVDSIWPLAWLIFSNLLILFSGIAFAIWQIHRPLRRGAAALERSARNLAPIAMPNSAPTEFRIFAQRFNELAGRLQAQERERALLLASVSHDLRAPLTRIRLHAELLDDDESTGAHILSDADSMRRVIDQFLDYQRSSNQLLATRIDVSAVVTDVIRRYLDLGNRIQLQSAEAAVIFADPSALERILSNLIDNAFSHGTGPVELSIAVTGSTVRVSVRDHGPGIDMSEVDRLLQPFERFDKARSRQGHCGLGLSIVNRLLKELGGTLTLSNHPQGGLLAAMDIPLIVAAEGHA